MYDQDGLRSIHNHEFMTEAGFIRAYNRGVEAAGVDYRWHWRVHVGLWAAKCAMKLDGDFVECGVNRGFLSSAIMQLLDWNNTDRTFYLLDTFSGISEKHLSDEDRARGVMERNQRDIDTGFYTFDVELVRRNFAEWEKAKIIVGPVPETLSEVTSKSVAFLHLDLNCSMPEVATIRTLWDRLRPGAMILLDDYAYSGYESQKIGMDEFAREKDIAVLSLPTGQGLIVRPPS